MKTMGSRVARRSKTLHLSARGVATVPGSNPGCITSGHDWESDSGGAQLAEVGSHCK
jgi:hypothetical protein